MVKGRAAGPGGYKTKRICPALHGGVTRHSRFSEFLSCESVHVSGGLKSSVLTAFVFPAAGKGAFEALTSPQMLAALASATAALGGAHSGDLVGLGAPEVSMACIPFLAPGWGNENDRTAANGDSDGLTPHARSLQQGLSTTCFAQAAMATLQFALNDGISGLIGCGIATLGMQAASPSGYRFLPSYIVLAFCNGTMQVLVGSELASSHQLMTLPGAVTVKLASIVALASPAVMFLGLAVAWHLHCELRAIALGNGNVPGAGARSLGLPTVDGVALAAGAQDGAIGQGGAVSQAGGPFRAFQGQPHRLAQGETK